MKGPQPLGGDRASVLECPEHPAPGTPAAAGRGAGGAAQGDPVASQRCVLAARAKPLQTTRRQPGFGQSPGSRNLAQICGPWLEMKRRRRRTHHVSSHPTRAGCAVPSRRRIPAPPVLPSCVGQLPPGHHLIQPQAAQLLHQVQAEDAAGGGGLLLPPPSLRRGLQGALGVLGRE